MFSPLTAIGMIFLYKEGKSNAVAHFAAKIDPELADGIVIVTVPSHDPSKPGAGLKKLAAAPAKSGNRVDGSDCLVRTKKIAKLASGGDRSKEIHLESIEVAKADLIKGKNVLLLDDVTKTGNSLEACAELLLSSGAKVVQRATIWEDLRMRSVIWETRSNLTQVSYFKNFCGHVSAGSSTTDLAINSHRPSLVHSAA
jgi:hypothetical protein